MGIMDLANDVLVPASRRPIPDDGTGAGLEAQDRRIVAALAMPSTRNAGTVAE